VFIVVWQDLFKFVAEAAGMPNFGLINTWGIADTLFCEVSLTSLLANFQNTSLNTTFKANDTDFVLKAKDNVKQKCKDWWSNLTVTRGVQKTEIRIGSDVVVSGMQL